jgi:muramidase (phage lysozyme)
VISPNARALLDTIRYAEGTGGPDGYRTMFTGRLFDDLSRHPRQLNSSNGHKSDAAGGYQFLSTTWDGVANSLGLTDFSPASQDRAALELIRRRGVDPDAPLTKEALNKLAPEWASLPTMEGRSYYGQPVKSHDAVFRRYSSRLGAPAAPLRIAGGGKLPASPAPAPLPDDGFDPTQVMNQVFGRTSALGGQGSRPAAAPVRSPEELAQRIMGTTFAGAAGFAPQALPRMAGDRMREVSVAAGLGLEPERVLQMVEGMGKPAAPAPVGEPLASSGGEPLPLASGGRTGRIGGATTGWKRDPDAEQSGYDLVKPGGVGAPIVAPVDLEITGKGFQGSGSGESGRGYGNWLSGRFKGADGQPYELLLGHLDGYDVQPGTRVPAGTVLGRQGITGRAFGAHVTTHVNALSGGDPWGELDRLTRMWTASN